MAVWRQNKYVPTDLPFDALTLLIYFHFPIFRSQSSNLGISLLARILTPIPLGILTASI